MKRNVSDSGERVSQEMWSINVLIYKTERVTGAENNFMVNKGEKRWGGGIDGETQTDTHAHYYT